MKNVHISICVKGQWSNFGYWQITNPTFSIMKKTIILLAALFSCFYSKADANKISSFSDDNRREFYPVRERMLTCSLNDTWKFEIFKGLEIPAEYEDWINPSYNDYDWYNIAVPGNWETQGFKIPEYGRDIEEYTGLYRTSFKFDEVWKGKNVILRFDGVHFGYECYLNGRKVGEFGSAFNLCQFDITPYLNTEGDNILCVKVSTRSFGWLFDTNDCWSLAGITRDVEIFTVANVYLEDITYVSEVAADLDATVKVSVDVGRFKEQSRKYKLNISMSDPQNNHVLDFSSAIDPAKKDYAFEGRLRQPKLWTAETPNLYRLEVWIVDDKGYVIQRANERVGVRSVYVDGYEMKVNNKPVLLRGVAVNEIDAKQGRALTYEQRRKELDMMKAANINFVRTAHYPFGPDFLQLCDEMGFYVCDEVPFGSRGSENLKNEAYLPELIARAKATLKRDKNHPSVIIWSLGNENPYTPIVEEILKYVKAKDPTRPRGLPQSAGNFMNFTSRPSKNVDVIMGHYLNDTRITQAVENTKIPIIHTEYAHSLGLAFDDLEVKYARILKEKKVIGGAIWCWGDQAVMTYGDHQQNEILKSVWIDSLRFMDSYGRTKVAEGKRELWKEAADGIVYGDGYPQEDYFQVRKVYSPVIIHTEKLNARPGASNTFELELESRFDFISLHGYRMNWQIKNINNVLESGDLWLQTPAREKEKISVAVNLPAEIKNNDLMLSLEILDPSGKAIYEKTLTVDIAGHPKDYRSLVASIPQSKKFKTTAGKAGLTADMNNTLLTISDKGILSVIDVSGKKVAETALLLRVGRPFTITLDYRTQDNKYYWDPYILTPVIEKFETSKQKDSAQAKLTCRWNRVDKPEEYVSGVVTVTVSSNGAVLFDYVITPSENASGSFLECGLTLKLDPSFDVLRWLGKGPFTYTPGKTAYDERGLWAMHKNDLRFIGNRGLVDLAVITDDGERGIGLWSDSGNIAVENVEGSIYVSQNVIVTGYGSKFTDLKGRTSAGNIKNIKGCLLLFTDSPSRPVELLEIFKPYSTVVPEQPYMKSYGW